jgi:hypothetical protein
MFVSDRAEIKAEIERLSASGTLLSRRELIAGASGEAQKKLIKSLQDSPQRQQLLQKPNFGREYQTWYSPALKVVEQLLPDRYQEFRDLYKDDRRKRLHSTTFGIADYISGIRPYDVDEKAALSLALSAFDQQIAIVGTAEGRLDSVLTDISRTLHAEILDNELSAARNLLKVSHVRSAGVIAGVALEGHLKKLIADHSVSFRKTATLSNLNEALKSAGVYDAPQWRQIQYLTDIRNLCGHKNDRDPTQDEVHDLIDEVEKIIKNLF